MRMPVLFLACLMTPLAQAAEKTPIPPSVSGDATAQPEVTISREAGQTVEEYRANGKLYQDHAQARRALLSDRRARRRQVLAAGGSGFRPARAALGHLQILIRA